MSGAFHFVVNLSVYSGDPKTGHSKTGNIQKPDIFVAGIQITQTIRKPDILVRFLNDTISLNRFI